MRRFIVAGVASFGFVAGVGAQQARPIVIPELSPKPPATDSPPQPLPSSVIPAKPFLPREPQAPGKPGDAPLLPPKSETVLPYPEKKVKLTRSDVMVRREVDGWKVWGGKVLVKNFGEDKTAAEDAARVIRDLGPIEWASLGTTRPVVGYPINDDPTKLTTQPKLALPIDMLSVRADNVRGVWVVRDQNAIHLNFGPDRADAEQAAAVVRKYGFNKVGYVGPPGGEPSFSYFFAAPEEAGKKVMTDRAAGQLHQSHQEQTLTRTGVPVPGVGFLGERVVVDAKKLVVRRDGMEFVLAHGSDTIAKFGGNEWSARDAARVLQDMKVTEFCRVGGQTFFLVNGRAPDRVPFTAQGMPFDPKSLVVRPVDGKFVVSERNGRQVFTVATKEDGENVIRTVQGFGFDQTCQVGLNGPNALRFLAKSR